MPPKPKPPRLQLKRREKYGRRDIWIIRDQGRQIATGCGEGDIEGAEKALQRYIAAKWSPGSQRAADSLTIAQIISAYALEHVPSLAQPDKEAGFLERALEWWGERPVSDIKGQSCRAYTAHRVAQGVSDQTARREMEALRAAVNYFNREYGLDVVPAFTLPQKAEPRERWLTRQEAARAIRAARRDPRTAHVARFILIGIYSGRRPGAILKLRWLPSPAAGHFDMEAGLLHGTGKRTRRSNAAAQRRTKKRAPTSRIHTRLLPHLRRWRRADMALGIPHAIHYQGRQIAKLRRSWRTVMEKAGLGPEVTPHILRHTHGTWQAQSGTPDHEAAGFMGMSVEIFHKTYTHHSPDYQSRAATARGGTPVRTPVRTPERTGSKGI